MIGHALRANISQIILSQSNIFIFAQFSTNYANIIGSILIIIGIIDLAFGIIFLVIFILFIFFLFSLSRMDVHLIDAWFVNARACGCLVWFK